MTDEDQLALRTLLAWQALLILFGESVKRDAHSFVRGLSEQRGWETKGNPYIRDVSQSVWELGASIWMAARRKDAPIMPIDYYLKLRLLWNLRMVLRMREQDQNSAISILLRVSKIGMIGEAVHGKTVYPESTKGLERATFSLYLFIFGSTIRLT